MSGSGVDAAAAAVLANEESSTGAAEPECSGAALVVEAAAPWGATESGWSRSVSTPGLRQLRKIFLLVFLSSKVAMVMGLRRTVVSSNFKPFVYAIYMICMPALHDPAVFIFFIV